MSARPDTFRYRYSSLDGGTVDVAAPDYVRNLARKAYRRDRRHYGDSRHVARAYAGAFLLWTTTRANAATPADVEAVTS